MDVVIYTEDFEPITVISLTVMPQQIRRYMGGRFYVEVPQPMKAPGRVCEHASDPIEFKKLGLRVELMRWLRGEEKFILVAEDEVLALQLRPSWLPGQRGEINAYRHAITQLAQLINIALGGD